MATKYDKRVEQLEEQMTQAGKLPPHAQGPYLAWPAPGEEADFSAVKADLMARFGTIEGAIFRVYSWGKRLPENYKKQYGN